MIEGSMGDAAEVERPTALWVAFAAAEGLVVAAFMKWFTISEGLYSSFSRRGIDGLHGQLTCLVGLSSLILLLLAMDRPLRRRQICVVVTVLGVIGMVFAFGRYVTIQDEVMDEHGRSGDGNSMDFGIFATLASAIVLTVAGFVLLRRWKPDPDGTAPVGA